MLQRDLTDDVVTILLDQVVTSGRNGSGPADLQALVSLLRDRAAAVGVERNPLERFLHNPADQVALDEFRRWLREQSADRHFRSSLVQVLTPVQRRCAAMPGGGDLTEKVIVTLLDRAVAGGHDPQGADVEAVVTLLADRMATVGADRGPLQHFLSTPMDGVSQNTLRAWLREELDDQNFRARLAVTLAPVLRRYAAMPGGSAPYQPGRPGRSGRSGKPNRPGTSGKWPTFDSIRSGHVSWLKLALAVGAVLVVCIVVVDRLTASSPSSTPGAQIQTTSTTGPQGSATNNGQPPQVQTADSPVASFTVPGALSGTAASGALLLGAPEPATSDITQSAYSQGPCADIDLKQAVAVPFKITLTLGAHLPGGTLSVYASLTWPPGTTPPNTNQEPLQVTATSAGEQCGSSQISAFPNSWSSETDIPTNAAPQQTIEGWFVFPLAASTSAPNGNLTEMAFYELLISVFLPGAGNSALSAYGPMVCQGNFIQLVGQLNQQNGCGQFPTPAATPSS